MSQLKQTLSSGASQVKRQIVLGRIQIDLTESGGLNYVGHFRKMITIDGDVVTDRVFDPNTRRKYPSEEAFRSAIREAVTTSPQLQALLVQMQSDPSFLVDAIALLTYGLLQADQEEEAEQQ